MSEKKTTRPKRVTKPNRRFVDSNTWCNVSIESLPSPTLPTKMPHTPPIPPPAPRAASTPAVALPLNREVKTVQHSLGNDVPCGKSARSYEPKKSNARNGAKFIRFRFQIDCAVAVDVVVDELVSFLKQNMKIDQKRNNLADVTIERRRHHVHILAKVMLKKKYLKRLVKQFLRKKKLFDYRVLQKNKRAYKVILRV